jgi:hypothetical protein
MSASSLKHSSTADVDVAQCRSRAWRCELKGFSRVNLAAGETKTVSIHVAAKDISFWSPATHQRATEASSYDVWVGDSSMAVEHGEFEVRTTMVQR